MASTKRTKRTKRAKAGSVAAGRYHFLDVGTQRYGDCVVVEFGSCRVLIDGGHDEDFDGQEGSQSTKEQLKTIFGGEASPHPITLVVVTHCHQDHVSALRRMIVDGVIKPDWALVTDHRLGFGRTPDDADAVDLVDERTRRLAAAVREEDAFDLADTELRAFIDRAAAVEPAYQQLLVELHARGVKVVEYRGQQLPAELLEAVKPTGMTLLGPSLNQLLFAAQHIATTNHDVTDVLNFSLADDPSLSDMELYRSIMTSHKWVDVPGQHSRASGMNCQSITLAFGPMNARALLAGDMQFADADVAGAEREMAKFLEVVKSAGPYRLYKTTHHSSRDGQNDQLLTDLGNPAIVIHSGGYNDPRHPSTETLEMLKQRTENGGMVFARTDRNGRVTAVPNRRPQDAVAVSRGTVNDFTINLPDAALALSRDRLEFSARSILERKEPHIIVVNLSNSPIDLTVAGVKIEVRQPSTQIASTPADRQGRVILGKTAQDNPVIRSAESTISVNLADGRILPKLLFVTDSEKLTDNIGQSEVTAALVAARRPPHTLLDLAGRPENASDEVRNALNHDNSIVGVVILGGYDVIPSMPVNVLSKKLRDMLTAQNDIESDGDQFVVWSDEHFGDLDGDNIAERPVSRIPDARDSKLFLKALGASAVTTNERFGIRNVAREFAASIWTDVPGTQPLNVSKAFLSGQIASKDQLAGLHYFMLHGNEHDGTVFSGEDGRAYTRAFTIDKVPAEFSGVVFSGCCWGALSVSQKAIEIGKAAPAPRVTERSIALSFLKAGANAFVGCTGSHYSGPSTDANVNYAAPFHSAFWRTFPKVSNSASMALFGARKYYGDLIGSDTLVREPLEIARRLKNRAQFTCLGLGW